MTIEKAIQAQNVMNSSVIEAAVNWAIAIANDNSHGYSMTNRDGPDYDCSSLMCWAYYEAGLNTRPGYTPATSGMYKVFINAGFKNVTSECNLSNGGGMKRGDVLLYPGNPGHTAMYIGSGKIVHASWHYGNTQAGDQKGNEILVQQYYNHPWNYVLRYGDGGGDIEPTPGAVSLVRWIPG